MSFFDLNIPESYSGLSLTDSSSCISIILWVHFGAYSSNDIFLIFIRWKFDWLRIDDKFCDRFLGSKRNRDFKYRTGNPEFE